MIKTLTVINIGKIFIMELLIGNPYVKLFLNKIIEYEPRKIVLSSSCLNYNNSKYLDSNRIVLYTRIHPSTNYIEEK